jgi:hypothetical protein
MPVRASRAARHAEKPIGATSEVMRAAPITAIGKRPTARAMA